MHGCEGTYLEVGYGSLAIRIPKPIAEQWGVEEGSAIEIVPRGDRLVLIKKAYDLNNMLAAIEPGNLHTEVDAGSARRRRRMVNREHVTPRGKT